MKLIRLLLVLIFCVAAAGPLWAAPIALMPLGDSITKGVGPVLPDPSSTDGYRRQLWESLSAAGYDFDFVGFLENGTFSEKQHEGHGGETDLYIWNNVYNFLTANPAKIILLHIGTNQLGPAATEVEGILDEIDRWEVDHDQTVIVILARIINRQGYTCPNPSLTTDFNDNVEAMALGRVNEPPFHSGPSADQPDRIVIVDMECGAGLDYNADMADLLHPNTAGYEKMAAKWLVAGLEALLPLAVVGPDQAVNERTVVTLDGSGSFDPDDILLQYSWEQVPPGTVALSNPGAPNPTFTAPEVGPAGAGLAFRLTITDSDGFQHSNTVNIQVGNVPIAPVADAGLDHSAEVGATVTLDGSNTRDPDGLITAVQWEQTAGTQVVLATPTALTTVFTAPAVVAGQEVLTLTFKLTVRYSDNLVNSDTVNIRVRTELTAPVADAGLPQSAAAGATVTLDGSNSRDPDGLITAVQWEQVAGTQVGLATPTALRTVFTAPAVNAGPEVLTFKLTVTDDDYLVREDLVDVTINPAQATGGGSSSGGGGGGGCFIQTAMHLMDSEIRPRP